MRMEILVRSGIMDISTNKDLNILYDLLEVFTHLGVTFTIDKIYFNQDKHKVKISYVPGFAHIVEEV